VTTSYVNALNITALGTVTAGTFNGVLFQTSASNYRGIKMSSSFGGTYGGMAVYGDDSIRFHPQDSTTLLGYIGNYSGALRITSNNTNLFLTAGGSNTVYISATTLSPLNDASAYLGNASQRWAGLVLYAGDGSPSTSDDGLIVNYASGGTNQFRGCPGTGGWVGSFDMTAV
jgi:hypothetical protein